MQDAVDSAELNGYLRSFKTNQETKKQKMELDEDCARVVAEVKTKNYVLSLSRSHGCCLSNSIVMFRIFTSRLVLVIDYHRLLSIVRFWTMQLFSHTKSNQLFKLIFFCQLFSTYFSCSLNDVQSLSLIHI